MEINIKPEDIDRLIQDAVVKSSIGKLIERTVAETTKLGAYNSPIDGAIRVFVQDIATAVLRDQYRDRVLAAVATELSVHLTDEAIQKSTTAMVERFISAIRESRY